MNRQKCSFALALMLALFAPLTGCTNGQDASSAPPPVQSQSSSEPQPEPQPQPPAAVSPSVLTGLPVPEEEVPGTRIAAVVVGNTGQVRPQSGLSAAQLLYELPMEGGITRFVALFEDYKTMPEVGPVRSSRGNIVQLALPWQALLVVGGGGQMHDWYVQAFEQEERLLEVRDAAGFHDESRLGQQMLENTYYTSGSLLKQAVEADGLDDARQYGSTIFEFLPFGVPARVPAGGTAESLKLPFSDTYITSFDYNSATQRYEMGQYNLATGTERVPAIDQNTNTRLAYDNVLVLFAEMPVYQGTEVLLDIQYGHGGVGYYFSAGGWERIRWSKSSPQHPLRLYNFEDGTSPVEVNPGTSYVGICDVEMARHFAFGSHGQQLSLEQREENGGS